MNFTNQKSIKKLIVTGSGSGGHVLPLLAVSKLLKDDLKNDIEILYIGQKNDKFVELLKDFSEIDSIKLILAGKFRRYNGAGWTQYFDVITLLKNTRDFFFVLIGFVQSLLIIRKFKPDALFVKGGYIGVPVGFAAALFKVPIVTHDSDVHPGLANRLIARWVAVHSVGMDPSLYPYPTRDTVEVGVPIRSEFEVATKLSRAEAKEILGLDPDVPVVLIMGGSLGAESVNKIVLSIKDKLTSIAYIIHQTGGSIDSAAKTTERYSSTSFINDKIAVHIAAADVVVSRAGATAISEIIVVGRPLVLIPNDYLTGGHQSLNAEFYSKSGAAVVLNEKVLKADPTALIDVLTDLINSHNKQKVIVDAQKALAKPDATSKLVKILKTTMLRGSLHRHEKNR